MNPRLRTCWPALLIGSIWLWMFLPMMSGSTVAGFRDSTQLYYPLFQFIDEIWAAGEIPLWNPYDNFGAPLIADGISSVFYPGKLIFLLRFLDYPSRYGIYLALHVLLAAAGTYTLARTLKAPRSGATLAAISYAFGGALLFQLHNVVFLVSGAWLPAAMVCVWKMTETGRWAWPVAGAVCCSMMILGGDPQMVYHVGLIAVATLGGEFLRRRRRQFKNRNNRIHRGPYRWWLSAMLRMAMMVAITTCLSAVQLLPTAKWSERSERVSDPTPQNIYQAVGHAVDSTREFNNPDQSALDPRWYERSIENIHVSLFESPPPGSPRDHQLQFSLPPWSLMELAWPNVSGRPYPRHRRWTDRLAGAERIWVPSIYVGLVTLLLAMSVATLRKTRRRARWLTLTGLFFCIASFGWFGLVWLVNEFYLLLIPQPAGGNDFDLQDLFGPQVGGLYWAMTLLLPKYFVFRYPAKLFVVASLCLSVLAGLSFRRPLSKLPRFSCLLAVASVTGIVVVWSGWTLNRLNEIAPNPLFGPFEISAARWDLTVSFVHSLVVISGLAFFVLARQKSLLTRKNTGVALVLFASIDIVAANQWMKLEIPSTVMTTETTISDRLKSTHYGISANAENELVEPLTVYRSRNFFPAPPFWPQESSTERLSEIVVRQRETLAPKNQLEHRVALVGSFTSIWPLEYEQLLQTFSPPPRYQGFQFAGVHRFLLPGHIHQGVLFDTGLNPATGMGRVVAFPGLEDRSISELGLPVTASSCRITSFSCNRIELEADSDGDQILLLNLLSDDGWRIEAQDETGKPVSIKKADCHPCFTALAIPENAGRYSIKLVYDPFEFRVGGAVSAISWGVLIFVFATMLVKQNPMQLFFRRSL